MLEQYVSIPEELRSLPHWVAYGSDKVLRNPASGRYAESDNPETWGTFEAALTCCENRCLKGIGFVFSSDLCYFGIDLDTVRDPETGFVSPEAEDLIQRSRTYCEISQSGFGFHLIGKAPFQALTANKGKLPDHGIVREDWDLKNNVRRLDRDGNPKFKAPEIELYNEGQYFALTGNIVMGRDQVLEEPGLLEYVINNYFQSAKAAKAAKGQSSEADPPPVPPPQPLVSKNLLEIGLQRDSKLQELWNGKRPSGNESSDDQALLMKLIYWIGRDADEVRRAFESSPHYSQKDSGHLQKAQNKTYLAASVENAFVKFGNDNTAAEDDLEYQKGQAAPDNNGFMPFVPLEDSGAKSLPAFPVDCLPNELRKYAEAISESIQVAVDMPAVAELAVVSLCIAHKFEIQPKMDWTEPLNLYALVVARPSERKSPTLKAVSGCLDQYCRKINLDRQEDILTYQTELQAVRDQIEAAQNRIKKSKGKSGSLSEEELQEVKDEIVDLKMKLQELLSHPVKHLRLLADDTTQEALVSLLNDNGGRIGIVSSEGGLFDTIAGKYSSGVASTDVFTKAYSGDSIRVDRRGREREEIENPALTMLLTVQPSVLQEIMENGTFSGRGLLARFLYSLPVSVVGTRKFSTNSIPVKVRLVYECLIEHLLSIPDPLEPHVITLSPEASEEAEIFAGILESRLNDDLAPIEDWAGKYHGNIMRIAGCLHCCKHKDQAQFFPVSLETMQAAEQIGAYFLEHAQAAHKVMNLYDSAEVMSARYLLKRLGGKDMSKRDLFNLCKGHFHKVEEMQPGLDELIQRGYLKIETTQTGGRPSEMVYFNPIARQTQ